MKREFYGTPNVWQVRDGINLEIIADNTGFGVVNFGSDAELKDADYPKEIALANANIMAASPELLIALQELSEAIDIYWQTNTHKQRHVICDKQYKADEIIKKALGNLHQ